MIPPKHKFFSSPGSLYPPAVYPLIGIDRGSSFLFFGSPSLSSALSFGRRVPHAASRRNRPCRRTPHAAASPRLASPPVPPRLTPPRRRTQPHCRTAAAGPAALELGTGTVTAVGLYPCALHLRIRGQLLPYRPR